MPRWRFDVYRYNMGFKGGGLERRRGEVRRECSREGILGIILLSLRVLN